METLGNIEPQSKNNKDLENFLLKMSSPIVRKNRKDIKTYIIIINKFKEIFFSIFKTF